MIRIENKKLAVDCSPTPHYKSVSVLDSNYTLLNIGYVVFILINHKRIIIIYLLNPFFLLLKLPFILLYKYIY